jgi:WD40 repeat protein
MMTTSTSSSLVVSAVLAALLCCCYFPHPTLAAAAFLSPQQNQHQHQQQQQQHSSFVRKRSFLITPQKDTNSPNHDHNNMEEYNDFGDFIPGDNDDGGDGTESTSASNSNKILKDRVDELRDMTTQKTAKLAQNWQQGNWKVRGFSLDPYSAKDDDIIHYDDDDDDLMLLLLLPNNDTKINKKQPSFISSMVLGDDDICVVGRSDGSVCLIELGTEYWARFDSQLTALETSNTTVKIESTLVRSAALDDSTTTTPTTTATTTTTLLSDSPFVVTCQFMAHEGLQITALLVAERNDDERVVVTATSNGDMTLWSVPEDDVIDTKERVLPMCNLDAHSDKVVAIKAASLTSDGNDDLLVSASRDGSIALWDLWTGDLIYKCQMQEGDAKLEITSLDAKDQVVFLGLATGHVVSYLVPEMVQAASVGDSCPVPNGRFLAHGEHDGGVTSVTYGGPGNLSPTSSILITGGADGTVKQWEILPRSAASSAAEDSSTTTVLEHWPRLATQRMPKRAHVFATSHMGGNGDDLTITALASHGDDKIISASADGTVRAWSPTTGKELYMMAGFTSALTSLCLNQDMLVTNGMNQFVCVHDFDVNQEDLERDGLDSIEW